MRTLVLFCALAFVGCSNSPHEMATATGVVKIDGKPLTDGSVIFTPVANDGDNKPGKPAWGKLQEDGTFTLSTYEENDGAIVGTHRASVSNKSKQYKFEYIEVYGQAFEVKSDEENTFVIDISKDFLMKYGQIE